MAAVTRELARYAVESRFEDLPEAVRHEGERAFVNILGCMLGGAKAPGIDRLLEALQEFSGRPEATLIGRGQRAEKFLGQAAIGYRANNSEAPLAEAWRIREVTTVGGFIRRWFDGP